MKIARVGWLGKVALAFGFVIGGAAVGQAADWFDDFNDGNATDGMPVTWLENLGGSAYFPGVYTASSTEYFGDYFLDPADDGPLGYMSALVTAHSFTDVYARTQGRVLPDPNDPMNDGGNLVLTARVTVAGLTGYILYFDTGGNLQLQSLDFGAFAIEDIGTPDYVAPFNASEDAVMELSIVGDVISGYVWQPDDPNGKPVDPQVTALISELDPSVQFASGVTGLGYAEDNPFTSVVYRYAASQSTPFVDGQTGDQDGDDDVDGEDLLIIQRGIGSGFDGGDITDWADNFGAAPSVVAAGAVPEPASLALFLVGATAAGWSMIRRSRE